MKINEGKTDRTIRLILGILLLILGLTTLVGTIKVVSLVVGSVCLFTGITGFCLLYELFGINTNKNKE